MGNCLRGVDENTKYIESHMKEDERYENSLQKLLFLGAGGSGKSTIFKQLQYLHCDGYTRDDALHLKRHIFLQTICTMQSALKYVESKELKSANKPDADSAPDATTEEIKDTELTDAIAAVENHKEAHILTPHIARCISIIWNQDPRFEGIFEDINASLDQTTRHFWDDVDRISDENYVPSRSDIINVRYRTTGVLEKKLQMNNYNFHIFDVGGQKSERKKWTRCFEEVHAVIFVVSLSSYNEMMFEDRSKNAMVDSMELFQKTVGDSHFKESSFITFLNKKDLFEEKIAKVPVTVCPAFEGFDGKDPHSFQDATSFIQKQFHKMSEAAGRTLYSHVSCALDPNNINKIFQNVTQMIVQRNMRNNML